MGAERSRPEVRSLTLRDGIHGVADRHTLEVQHHHSFQGAQRPPWKAEGETERVLQSGFRTLSV